MEYSEPPCACFHIAAQDNVATLLQDAPPETPLLVRGAPELADLRAREVIRAGHKVALRPIAPGDPVIKYGYSIGEATRLIMPGDWVHLHNCRSLCDQASSSLDLASGVRPEMPYV